MRPTPATTRRRSSTRSPVWASIPIGITG
jgi:hypothetical protein